MPNDAIVIFTSKSVETILADGGSQSWKLHPGNARNHQYVVLCRNRNRKVSEADVIHGSAFMVGKLANVVQSTRPRSPARSLILFSEYALVNVSSVWDHWRNPIKYTSMADLGIDPDSLEFRPMPEREPVHEAAEHRAAAAPTQITGLTIAEAKKALAATYGVGPEGIEITIRG